MPSLNKRQYRRVDIHGYSLEYASIKGHAFEKALLVNLSECGALILTSSLLHPREFLSIRLHGVLSEGYVSCKARVVHLGGDRVHPMHYYAGLRFQDLTEAHKIELRRFVDHKKEKPLLSVG